MLNKAENVNFDHKWLIKNVTLWSTESNVPGHMELTVFVKTCFWPSVDL